MPTAEDYELLGRLVAADNVAEEPRTFTLIYPSGGREIIGHSGWPQGQPTPSELQVDELESFGWVRVTSADGKGRQFSVTGTGRRAWGEHVAQRSHVPSRVKLDWPAARPLLEQIYDQYQEEGAPARGVDTLPMTSDKETGQRVAAIVRELARSGFLEVVWASADGPRMVRPSPVTLQMLGGWPVDGAQEALTGLVDALTAEIDRTPDPERRSVLMQVRDGLVGAARDIAIAYIEKKIGAA